MLKRPRLKKKVRPPGKRGRDPVDIDDLRVKLFYDTPKSLNDEQLCKHLGISKDTFYKYKKENTDFSDAIKFYRKITAIDVLKSFTKVAVGFSYDETVSEFKKNKETGEMEMVVTKITNKMVPPNADAGYKYLKNQMQEQFREKIENTHVFEGLLDNITFVIKGKE